MPPQPLLVQDACVLINLVASGCFEKIARQGGFRFVVASAVCAETHYTREAVSGKKVPIDLVPHFAAGLLEQIEVETPAELAAYFAFAAQGLDDGEAMSLALAQVRRLPLATDDRQARLLVANEKMAVELHGTVSVLAQWETLCHVPRSEMAEALTQIRKCARFVPGTSTPEHAWWLARLGD